MAKWFELPDLPIRITARGEWLHGDEPLHPRVATLFAHNVVPTADGIYSVQLGYAKQELEVEDTAFFVRSVRTSETAGALDAATLVLSDGKEEPLDPATLMQSADNVFYCTLRRHDVSVPCRFTSAQYHALALHAEVEEDAAYLLLGGQRWPIKPYAKRPRA